MSRSERFAPSGLAFLDGHFAVAIPNQLDLISFLSKNRAFFGLVWRPFWLIVTAKSLPSVAQSPRGESLNVFGRSHKLCVTLDKLQNNSVGVAARMTYGGKQNITCAIGGICIVGYSTKVTVILVAVTIL